MSKSWGFYYNNDDYETADEKVARLQAETLREAIYIIKHKMLDMFALPIRRKTGVKVSLPFALPPLVQEKPLPSDLVLIYFQY